MKKQTKAARVRELDRAGFTVKQIAAKAGCDTDYVYMVRYMDKKKAKAGAPKRKPGRPKKVTGVNAPVLTQRMLDDVQHPPVPVVVPRLTWKQRLAALFTGRTTAWTAR